MIELRFFVNEKVVRVHQVVLPYGRIKLRENLMNRNNTFCQNIRINDENTVNRVLKMAKVLPESKYVDLGNKPYRKTIALNIIWEKGNVNCICMMYVYYVSTTLYSKSKQPVILDVFTKCLCVENEDYENEKVDNIVSYIDDQYRHQQKKTRKGYYYEKRNKK